MERDFEDIDRILNFAADAGRVMLKCGGEIYRVEETIQRLCMAFGVDNAEVFATPTTLLLSVYKNKKVYSVVKRISERSTDLNMMKEVNALSRTIAYKNMDIEECEKELEKISKKDNYSKLVITLGAGLVASTFSILFGGGLIDFLASFVAGILTKLLIDFLNDLKLNEFFVNIISAGFIAVLSIICFEIGIIKTMDYIIPGVIMLLVPGFALTNSIRDILDGQLVAGTAKLAEVLFIGTATAIGMALVLNWYLKGGFF
ncbi:MAG: threonine/serine exporter family protein [Fusobacterium sp.]|nr:threonine/serine exporter family protein [Fusobacterium sp.]